MAGIGFELKKLFSAKGMIATLRAYGYATMVCAGPMLLGFTLLLIIMYIADKSGSSRHDRELLVSMVTYALLASLTVTSLFSMLTSRFLADMVYLKEYNSIIPSFYGSLCIMLILGGVSYGIFLFFSGVILMYKLLSFLLFMTLIVVWTEINYLTAIKDYRSIILAFAVSLLLSVFLAVIFVWGFRIHVVISMMSALILGYGVMSVWYFILIYKYFPEGFGTSMKFMSWFDQTPQLGLIGFFITLGLFGHLVIMWTSRIRVQVEGLFYGAPMHDVSAIFAFFSILITTVNFVTSVETRFYPKYKDYFSLFNDGGSIVNIDLAEKDMLRVLSEELGYLAQKQLLATLMFIIIGTIVLPMLPLGFNSEMLRIYRTLCAGYAFYAIANSIMLVSQYFDDMKGALMGAAVFAIFTNLCTFLMRNLPSSFYGFGFVLGSALFCLVAWYRLCFYLHKLKYHVLSQQNIVVVSRFNFFTDLYNKLEPRARRVQRSRFNQYNKRRQIEVE